MRRRNVRPADIDALIKGVLSQGLAIEAVEITPEGSVRALILRDGDAEDAGGDADWVALAGEQDRIAAQALEQARARTRRAARREGP